MKLKLFPVLDYGALIATFVILAGYTAQLFLGLPYLGFDQIAPDGSVQYVWQEQPGGLRLGDRLLAAGETTLESFWQDLRRPLLPPVTPGDVIAFTVVRADQTLTVTQTAQPFIWREFLERLFSQWFLAWAFWLAAVAMALLVRPRDTRWRLLIFFNLLTALWLGASVLSRWHLGESALVLRAAVWLCVPIYWHLHVRFPTPLWNLPRPGWWALYAVMGALALGEVGQVWPPSTYAFGFLFAFSAIPVTWIARALRREPIPGLRLILTAVVATGAPVLAFSFFSLGTQSTITATALGLLALPILPFTYVYLASRRQLGGLELWANRAFAVYLYGILVMFVAALSASAFWSLAPDVPTALAATVALVGATAVLSLVIFPPFQRLVERHLLGLPLEAERMLETFVAQIVASTDLSSLVQTLREKVLPSLLVRQSALYRLAETGEATLVYTAGTARDDVLEAAALEAWRTGSQAVAESGWVRLPLTLQIDGAPIGLLLLGAHDPDDTYTVAEVTTLRAIADQTAIALAHAVRTEQLRLLFQANIERHEAERATLARDLHDDILQQMAVLGSHALSPESELAYASIVSHTRQMISGLRPVMLNYGLNYAIEQLADDLAERLGAQPEVRVTLQGESRYPALVEQHVFRVTQQAAENAAKHARGTWIEISGRLEPEQVDLWITDNGVGVPADLTANLNTLVAQRHFGLAGMVERAQLIGAELNLQALPQGGTGVNLRWPRRPN